MCHLLLVQHLLIQLLHQLRLLVDLIVLEEERDGGDERKKKYNIMLIYKKYCSSQSLHLLENRGTTCKYALQRVISNIQI